MNAPEIPPFGSTGDIRKWAERLQEAASNVRIDAVHHSISIAHKPNKQTDLTIIYNGLNMAPAAILCLLDFIEQKDKP